MPGQPSPPSSIPLLWGRNTQHFTSFFPLFLHMNTYCDKALQIWSCLLPSLKELRVFGQQSTSPNHSMDIGHHPCPCPGLFKKRWWADSLWAWTCNTGVLSQPDTPSSGYLGHSGPWDQEMKKSVHTTYSPKEFQMEAKEIFRKMLPPPTNIPFFLLQIKRPFLPSVQPSGYSDKFSVLLLRR